MEFGTTNNTAAELPGISPMHGADVAVSSTAALAAPTECLSHPKYNPLHTSTLDLPNFLLICT